MSQKENLELLLKLHHIITGTTMSLEEIISHRTIEPDVPLIYNSELGGKVSFGKKVSIKKYYFLGEQLEFRTRASEKA